MGEEEGRKVLILSVGGSPKPLIVSILHHRPSHIIFFSSRQSEKEINENILPHVSTPEYRHSYHRIVVSTSAEDLVDCYLTLNMEIRKILEEWAIGEGTPVVPDFTGGTKCMSVALALATLEIVKEFSYIGGDDTEARTKGGLGVVIDGKGRAIYTRNPWKVLAITDLQHVESLFEEHHFEKARAVLDVLKGHIPGKAGEFLGHLATMVEAYRLWNLLDHRQARDTLGRAREKLGIPLSIGAPSWNAMLTCIENNLDFLNIIVERKRGWELSSIVDLIAFSKRRTEKGGDFNLGVIALYSCLERFARMRLLDGYGIDNSDVRSEALPASLKDFASRYFNEKGGKIQLPLYASFHLLSELGDDAAKSFITLYNEKWMPRIAERNHCPLIHGDKPVTERGFKSFYNAIIETFNIDESSFPVFPEWGVTDLSEMIDQTSP